MAETATILLVEDEEFIRQVVREVLLLEGYRVLEASSAQQGLNRFAQAAGPVDLLLTDLSMPGMGGAELAARLAAKQPGLRVLFTSGHPDNINAQPGMQPACFFLQKPFTPKMLVDKVREALGRQPEGWAVAQDQRSLPKATGTGL